MDTPRDLVGTAKILLARAAWIERNTAIRAEYCKTHPPPVPVPPAEPKEDFTFCPLCGAHHSEWGEGTKNDDALKQALLHNALENPEFYRTLLEIIDEVETAKFQERIK